MHRLTATIAAALCLAPSLWGGRHFPARPGEQTASDELLLRVRPGVDVQQLLSQISPGARSRALHGRRVHLAKLPPGRMAGVLSRLAASADVEYVEPNRIRRAAMDAPADANYVAEWALQAVQALRAWRLLPGRYLAAGNAGTDRLKVAVLDTGVDCTHADFMNAGGWSTDSASGGQLLFAQSSAPVPTSSASPACSWQDDNGHGTHVAGTIAAAANNGAGVAGLAYPVQLLIFKVLDAQGYGNDATIADAIMAAADAGAGVISMSLGGTGYSQTLQDAVNYAWQRNALVVCAAGNGSTNQIFFPAAANHAVGVAATDSSGNPAGFSNYGDSVDIGAPGVSILSTVPGGYAYYSGTSMATPHVAAVGALLAMSTPSLAPDAIAQRIQQSANSNSGGWEQRAGYGVVDAWRALSGSLRTSAAGAIVGQVVDPDGYPVSGAIVSLGAFSITTDYTGLFRIPNLAAGPYNLNVSSSDYGSWSRTVAVAGSADSSITVQLGVALGAIAGTVTSGGAPAGGITVQAVANGATVASAITTASGQYWLAVPAGTYDVRASGVSMAATTVASQPVSAGSTRTVGIEVPRMGRITGKVTDSNGNPVANADVSVSGRVTAGAVTDAAGNYSTIGLPSGGYSVTAGAAGLPATTISGVSVAPNAPAVVNVRMGASGVVSPPAGFSAIRVNAGASDSYADSQGTVWAADYGYSGGAAYRTAAAISGAGSAALYQSERFGNFSYEFAVANGAYTVSLKFAEIYFTQPGQRVFNVAINGRQVLANFDIVAAAGAHAAVDRAFPVQVDNGQIAIQFTSLIDNAKVSAIEITPATAAPGGFSPVRVNAGGASYADAQGNTWAGDSGYSAGSVFTSPAAISNTTSPGLYQSERYGNFRYDFSVPNGNYVVTLKFAEIWFTQPGQRVFDVSINGQPVLSNFDIVAAAGARTAIDKTFAASVTNGQLSIQFTSVVDNAKVSAIEVSQ